MIRRYLFLSNAVAVVLVAVWFLLQLRETSTPNLEKHEPTIAESSNARSTSPPHLIPPPEAAPPEAPSADPARERIGDAASAESEPPQSTLRMVLQDRANGRPLAGVVILASTEGAKPTFSASDLATLHRWNGIAADAPFVWKSDATGRATVHWIDGRDLFLHFRPTDDEADELSMTFAGFPRELEELVIPLRVGTDIRFHGHVVEAGTGNEVVGATIEVLDGLVAKLLSGYRPDTQGRRIECDSSGRFTIDARSWTDPWFEVIAPGYGPVFGTPVSGHESAESEQRFKVRKTATLRARVVDARGDPVTDAAIRVSIDLSRLFQPEPRMVLYALDGHDAITDSEGRATLESLPAGVALDVHVVAPLHAPLTLENSLTLAPGANEVRQFTLGTFSRVTGRVFDGTGRPVAGVVVVLQERREKALALLTSLNVEFGARRSPPTGDDGRFEFDDVAEGRWWLGASPVGEFALPIPGTNMLSRVNAASRATPVDVARFAPEIAQDVVVTLERFIRGRVVPAGDDSVDGCQVTAQLKGTGDDDVLETEATEDGAFEFGPLVDGEWELRAFAPTSFPSGARRTTSEAPSFVVAAGTEGVELKLGPAGGLVQGSVVDATTRLPVDAQVVLDSERAPSVLQMNSALSGQFIFEPDSPGRYSLRATTRDGRIGVAENVVVISGKASGPFEIVVAPGAKLDVSVTGSPAECRFEVRRNATIVAADRFGSHARIDVVVPAGHLEIRLFRDEKLLVTREVDARIGTVVECRDD